jgi:hypothetical protein
MLTKEDIAVRRAWLACVVDTEGCITAFRRKSGNPEVSFSIGMISRAFIETFLQRSEADSKITTYRRKGKKQKNYATQFSTKISSRESLRDFLLFVEPDLVTKGDKARAAIKFLDRRLLRHGLPYDKIDNELFERVLHAKDA